MSPDFIVTAGKPVRSPQGVGSEFVASLSSKNVQVSEAGKYRNATEVRAI